MLYELVLTDSNAILLITKNLMILFKPQPGSCSLSFLPQFVMLIFV